MGLGNDTKQDIGRLEGRVESLLDDVEEVTKLLLGDGQPGSLERQTRIEEQLRNLTSLVQSNAEIINGLGRTVGELKVVVDGHVDDNDLHSYRMFLNKKVLSVVFFLFALAHTMLEKWDEGWILVQKWFGF
jgi:hypothetical protein